MLRLTALDWYRSYILSIQEGSVFIESSELMRLHVEMLSLFSTKIVTGVIPIDYWFQISSRRSFNGFKSWVRWKHSKIHLPICLLKISSSACLHISQFHSKNPQVAKSDWRDTFLKQNSDALSTRECYRN